MSTFTVGEPELMRLLGHPSVVREPLFARTAVLYAASRGGRGCCGRKAGPAGAAVWRTVAAASVRRHLATHPGVLLQAARQIFGLPDGLAVQLQVGGQLFAL
jgi:hypothetical protein